MGMHDEEGREGGRGREREGEREREGGREGERGKEKGIEESACTRCADNNYKT